MPDSNPAASFIELGPTSASGYDADSMVTLNVKKGDALWSTVTTGINFGPIEKTNQWGFKEQGKQVAIYTVLDSGSPYTILPAVYWDEIIKTFKSKTKPVKFEVINGKYYPSSCDKLDFPVISFQVTQGYWLQLQPQDYLYNENLEATFSNCHVGIL